MKLQLKQSGCPFVYYAELTRLYWAVGERLRREVLGGERAQYGAKIVDRLGERLSHEFGRGFEAKNLRRMMKFADLFHDAVIVATLLRQLSWSHFLQLHPLKSEEARNYYAHTVRIEGWSVRELRSRIEVPRWPATKPMPPH